jgi:gliding motility-associated-like protein
MKYTCTLIFFFVYSLSAFGQNVVHNPGFEQHSNCPSMTAQVTNYCDEWTDPTGASSDYYNTCCPNTIAGVPQNSYGNQTAYEANAYIGLCPYWGSIQNYREYVNGNINTLTPGLFYKVTIHVSRAESGSMASDNLGVFFYTNYTFTPTNQVLPVTAQVDYSDYGIITDATGWVTLADTFQADSAYTHIVVGSFKNDANTHLDTLALGNYAYYYVDYIDVEPVYLSLTVTPAHTNVSCHGGNNGTASVTAANGTAPYSYLWLPGNQTTPSISGLSAGSYTVRVIDAVPDTVIDTIVITEPAVLTATTTQTNVSCNGGNNGTATVTVSGGTTPYSYSWAPTGGNNATATGLTAGNYTCTITDANGCTLQKTFNITQAGSLTATTSQVNILCNGAGTGSATVSVSGGTPGYTYAWTPTGGNNATASNLTAGNYTCTITDANNCNLQKTFTLTQPSAVTATTSQTNVTCNGAGNGTASVTASGGVPGYTYSWTPSGGNAASASSLVPGTYTCTITDANNCTLQKTFTITQPGVLSATISHTDITCYGAGNGTATVTVSGGTTPYSYSWAPSGGNNATANNLVPATYTCTITDANGCTTSQSVAVTQPAQQLSVITSQSNILCNGAHTGVASVIIVGGTSPYSYSWAPTGGNASSATNLAAGSYTCTITDAHGCTIMQAFTITEAAAIVSATSHADILCHGNSNGIATVLVSGGTGPYTYSWAPTGGNGPNANGLAAGIYTCTATDHNNCIHTDTVTINEPAVISTTDSQQNVKCHGDSTAYAQVIVSGGTPPFTYLWAPYGGTGNAATGLAAGTYTCTIKDYNACIRDEVFVISEPTSLSVRSSKTNVVCQNINQGVAIAVGTGGVGPYSYLWTPGNTTDTIISGLGVSKDSCLVTDANGCTYLAVFNIVDTSQPFHYSVLDSAADCRSAWLYAAQDAGSSEAVSYTWSSDSTVRTGNPVIFTFPQEGPYAVNLVMINAVGCHDTISHSGNIFKPMVADFSFDPDPPMPNSAVHFQNLSTSYASIFRWNFGDGTTSTDPNPDKQYSDSGSYHVCLVASDTNNCIDTACKDIKADIDKVVGVPSAFSPNGDGNNDVLYIRGFRLKSVRLRVYNRWGTIVFETDTKDKGWDGTYKGQPQVEEVYAYTLEATYLDGTTVQKTGSITLIR